MKVFAQTMNLLLQKMIMTSLLFEFFFPYECLQSLSQAYEQFQKNSHAVITKFINSHNEVALLLDQLKLVSMEPIVKSIWVDICLVHFFFKTF
jgi:hypothetical protein